MVRPVVKVLGERSSGTNLLAQILADHFEVEVVRNSSGVLPKQRALLPGYFAGSWASRRGSKEAIQDHNHFVEMAECGGWKHAAATRRFVDEFAKPKAAHVLCLVRHPAAWARSMHRNPFHGIGKIPKDFSDFLHAPWIAAARDELGERVIANPIDLLTKKVESYGELQSELETAFVLTYENMILRPEETFQNTKLWQFRKSDTISLPIKSARAFGKGNGDLGEYLKKAGEVGYSDLETKEQEFVLNTISGSFLDSLYRH